MSRLPSAILDKLPPGTHIRECQKVTSLWAGYGSIFRIKMGGPPDSCILKSVTLEEDDGENADVGHVRKLISYQVERAFYAKSEFAAAVMKADEDVNLPTPIYVSNDKTNSATSGTKSFSLLIIMSDLSQQFPKSQDSMNMTHALSALRWLAGFHAHFWRTEPEDDEDTVVSQTGVWKQGSYWHLVTRREEFSRIPNSPRWRPIKLAAEPIAKLLSGGTTHDDDDHNRAASRRFRTLLHGDPKAENVVFGDTSAGTPYCAFYDFQYVGYGFGAVDVAYFLSTSVDGMVVEKHKTELLDYYYAEVTGKLKAKGLAEEAHLFTKNIFKTHFDWAIVDWVRFMAGWGQWGNAKWAERMAEEALKRLDLPTP